MSNAKAYVKAYVKAYQRQYYQKSEERGKAYVKAYQRFYNQQPERCIAYKKSGSEMVRKNREGSQL
ncbi:hypothetical protein [Endozoicomonas sp. SCSIO W0465]|uniref:hypothetical protein n=1 Tax=Endozoicomonas sp. SCSIO W0465 TaxID=2918516 RepID=UPI002075C7E8|nr:hypothetical protein [Endozoicomonas sp. SCSIO W0465]USE34165.1 hypothetical protein MJO57_18580 [Endozoicomonas sp. SCSIO W0465]